MFERALRTLSLASTLVVLASFGMFAVDETRHASDQTQIEIAGQQAATTPSPTATEERAREKAHSPVREAIDDADDVLLAPFTAAGANPDNPWAARAIPALLALLLYGFGFGFLARFASGRA